MTTYEILSRKWNELDRDVFGLGGILSTHYLRTTVGGSLWAFGWALVVTHPVLLFSTFCNSWKTSSCETYTMGREDTDHFNVEGGRLRHLEGCFTLPCR